MGQILVANIVLVLSKLGLGKNEMTVFLTMALHVLDEARDGKPAGVYWASRKRLLSDTGLSGTAVTVAIASLVRSGWLIRERDGKPGRTANYRISIDRLNDLVGAAQKEMAKAEKTGIPSIQKTGIPSIESTGTRTPEDSMENSTEEITFSAPREAMGTAGEEASTPWSPSPAQLETWQDFYVLAKLRLPSPELSAETLKLTEAQFETAVNYLWRDAHEGYRIGGGTAIDHRRKRADLVREGVIALLTRTGKRKLDERAGISDNVVQISAGREAAA